MSSRVFSAVHLLSVVENQSEIPDPKTTAYWGRFFIVNLFPGMYSPHEKEERFRMEAYMPGGEKEAPESGAMGRGQ